jgi:hypothetical protein
MGQEKGPLRALSSFGSLLRSHAVHATVMHHPVTHVVTVHAHVVTTVHAAMHPVLPTVHAHGGDGLGGRHAHRGAGSGRSACREGASAEASDHGKREDQFFHRAFPFSFTRARRSD